MGHLSTHVLDTSRGRPGAAIGTIVYRLENERRDEVARATTNEDGRCDAPLLEGDAFVAGEYEIHFSVGDYLARAASNDGSASADGVGARAGARPFLDTVVIRFGVANAEEHYHVPLLISPFAYSTYRGS